MKRFILDSKLVQWLSAAMVADTSYHKARKKLWDMFVKSLILSNNDSMDENTEIDDDIYTTICTYLTSKQDNASDTSRFSFIQVVNQLTNDTEADEPAAANDGQ